MKRAYTAFFTRCGLKTIAVEADTGVMGGNFSHEFMVPAPVGRRRRRLLRRERLLRQPREGHQRHRAEGSRRRGPGRRALEEFRHAGHRDHRGPRGRALQRGPGQTIQDPRLHGRRQAVPRGPARLRRPRGGEARRARLPAVARGHAGGDRAGHGRQARQPRHGQGHDQESRRRSPASSPTTPSASSATARPAPTRMASTSAT